MNKLKGKVAVVTGASKGIGSAIAKALAAEGASVVVKYASSKAGADTVVAAITEAGGQAAAVAGDVSKAADAQGIIDAAIKNYGRLDILVNNSGVYEFAPIEAATEDQFHRLFNVNVLGAILVTQVAVKHLGEGASIVNIGSASAASRLRTRRFTVAPKPLSTPSRACSPGSSGRRRSGSTPSTRAWSKPKVHTPAASLEAILRRT
jgi:NAD(P)-dependent dehydrogenase (short-subunit alcohol dehydrogenase family)